MNKFMTVVTNKWFRMAVSLLGIAYSIVLACFDYNVFFYDIEYVSRKEFAIIGSVFSLVICLLFMYTRKSVFTCIFGMVNMLLFFPLLLLDCGNLPLLLPAAVVTLFGFFCCHMNETAKTIFGTIFLLMYILGGIAFFLMFLFAALTSAISLLETSVSTLNDELHWSRGKCCLLMVVVMLVIGTASSFGYGIWDSVKILGMQFLDFFDFLTNSVMMPIAAIAICLLVSRVAGVKAVEQEVCHGEERFRRKRVFNLMIRYLCPLFAAIILVSSIANAFGWIRM